MKHFLVALQFLTILPVKIKSTITGKDFGKSLLYFPVVGLAIGLALAMVAASFGFLPDLLNGAFVLIALVGITGAIHLDGLADTCDGFYGSKTRERTLEIMRDSHIGVMGMLGMTGLLILKFALIVSLFPKGLGKALIMMAVYARWCQVLACFFSGYAREEGKAKFFIKHVTPKEVAIGALFTFVLFFLLAGFKGILLFALSAIPIFLFLNYAKKRIGGMTGDTIGATNEIAEAIVLLFYFLM